MRNSQYIFVSFLFLCFSGIAQTGIGTTVPVNKFQVETTTADPATSGNAANGNLRLSGTTGSHVLDFGLSSSSNYSWLQSRSRSNYGTSFNLILNPNGGNVGIGTILPTARLNIAGGGVRIATGFGNATSRPPVNTSSIGNYEIRAVGAGGGGGTTQSDFSDDGFLRLAAGGGTNLGTQSSIDLSGFSTVGEMNSNIIMRTAGTERLRIDLNGNVGIGTNNPSVRLHVSGDIIANSISGSSDSRFKKNVRPVTNALEKVKALQGVYFNWNQDAFPERDFSDQNAIGFIAQEVEKVLPEVVQTEKTTEGYKAVQYDKVVALLVEAIKEQQKEIDLLKEELKKKKSKRQP